MAAHFVGVTGLAAQRSILAFTCDAAPCEEPLDPALTFHSAHQGLAESVGCRTSLLLQRL